MIKINWCKIAKRKNRAESPPFAIPAFEILRKLFGDIA